MAEESRSGIAAAAECGRLPRWSPEGRIAPTMLSPMLGSFRFDISERDRTSNRCPPSASIVRGEGRAHDNPPTSHWVPVLNSKAVLIMPIASPRSAKHPRVGGLPGPRGLRRGSSRFGLNSPEIVDLRRSFWTHVARREPPQGLFRTVLISGPAVIRLPTSPEFRSQDSR